MGYTIPLRFIRIARKRSDSRQFDVAIPATRIVAIMSTEIYQARKTISDERKNGTLINGCGLSKAKSAIVLDNGSVVSSPLSVNKLLSIINESGDKINSKISKRMRVMDIYDPEPEDDEEEISDVSAEYDEFEDDDFEE